MFCQYRFGIYLALEWAHQIPRSPHSIAKRQKKHDPCSAFASHSHEKYNIPISILLLSAKPVIQVLLKVNVSFRLHAKRVVEPKGGSSGA